MRRHAPTDDALLVAAAESDDAAFAAFFLRHQTAVFGLLLRRTRDRELSRALTAETFAAALRRASQYLDDDRPADDWLLAIAEEKAAGNPAGDAARLNAAPVTGPITSTEDPCHLSA